MCPVRRAGIRCGDSTADCLTAAGTRVARSHQAKPPYLAVRRFCLVGAGGFEPPKSSTTDLQSAPFGHSGTLPYVILLRKGVGAGRRTRTPDLLITNQLLYQLSYTSTISSESYLNRIPFICQPLFYVLGGNFLRYIRRHHPDPQRVPPAETCHRCGAELYPGSPCWRFWGRTLCDECVAPWLLQELAAHRGRAGEVEP